MKKWTAFVMALLMLFALSACGGKYTAVSDLKLSWGMSPEEVEKAIPVQVKLEQYENNAYIKCMNKDDALPKVFGQKVLFFDCRFSDNKLANVNISFDATADYESLLKKCSGKFGEPKSMSNLGSAGFGTIAVNAVGWTTDSSVIVITYNEFAGMKTLNKMAFYDLAVFGSAVAK